MSGSAFAAFQFLLQSSSGGLSRGASWQGGHWWLEVEGSGSSTPCWDTHGQEAGQVLVDIVVKAGRTRRFRRVGCPSDTCEILVTSS